MSGNVGHMLQDFLPDELVLTFRKETQNGEVFNLVENQGYVILNFNNNWERNALISENTVNNQGTNLQNQLSVANEDDNRDNSETFATPCEYYVENEWIETETNSNFITQADTQIKEILGDEENEELEKPFSEKEIQKLFELKSSQVQMDPKELRKILNEYLKDVDYRKLIRLKWKIKKLSGKLKVIGKKCDDPKYLKSGAAPCKEILSVNDKLLDESQNDDSTEVQFLAFVKRKSLEEEFMDIIYPF